MVTYSCFILRSLSILHLPHLDGIFGRHSAPSSSSVLSCPHHHPQQRPRPIYRSDLDHDDHFFSMMIVHIFLISVLFVLSQAFIGDRTRTRSNIFSPHSNFNQLHFSHEQSVDDGNIPSSITSTVLRQVYPGMFLLH
jgi:hypothetical protein